MPLLKLFFNPNPLIQALHIQSQLNTMNAEREARREAARRAMDQLYYELIHNLVLETTRTGIEVKNLKMRVESLSSRLEFNERRARALESAVVYKPRRSDRERAVAAAAPSPRPHRRRSRATAAPRSRRRRAPPTPRRAAPAPAQRRQQPPRPAAASRRAAEGPGQRSRRRRRRRGRRGGGVGGDDRWAPDAGSPRDAATPLPADGRRRMPAERRPTATPTPVEPRRRRAVDDDRGAVAAAAPHRGRRASEPPTGRTPATAEPDDAVKLAVVVQRYGQAINGGAELHARYIAEHLARHAEVEVLTTCATDYVTWRNELPPGVEAGQRRAGPPFPREARARSAACSARRSDRVFEQRALARRRARLARRRRADQPGADRLHRASTRPTTTTACSSATATTTRTTARARPATRAILVPTAERDAAIGLSIFQPLFRGVRAVMYNSPEERAMIQAVVRQRRRCPASSSASDRTCRSNPQPARFRQKYNIRGPFAVYVGRIDENKGCKELFEFFQRLPAGSAGKLSLVLIGNSLLPIPEHPRIRHLGFLDDADKFDAMAAADLLIMPSYFESLSMVALEAWALGRPVLANGKCDVLKGQCIRSNAGLYYETLRRVRRARSRRSSRTAGWRGRSAATAGSSFASNYDWPVIERKYLDMFERLKSETPAPRPSIRCPAGSIAGARICRRPQDVLGAGCRRARRRGGAA